jgi:glucokinase
MEIIGVDLGGTKVKVGLVSGDKLVKVLFKEINSSESQNQVINEIEGVIDQVFTKKVKAIGIGVPSIVDVKTGVVFEVTNIPSWKEVPLKKILEKKYNVPVIVNNDANCFALGEKYFGEGKKYKHLVGITLGTGIGGGIIIDGRLYSGINCGAGEFCNISYLDSDLEHYSSGMLYKKLGVSGKELSRNARAGDKRALEIFREQGCHIGKLLSVVVNALDPEVIILTGSLINDYEFLKGSMMKSLEESIYKRAFSKIKIKLSKNKDIAVLGAASLYLDFLKEYKNSKNKLD